MRLFSSSDPITDSNTANGLLSHIFPNLTNIVPKAGIDVGLEIGATLAAPGISIAKATSTTLVGTDFSLPTACMSWDSDKTAFVSPTVSSTTTTTGSSTTATATGDGKSGKSHTNAAARAQEVSVSKTYGGCLMSITLLFVLFP